MIKSKTCFSGQTIRSRAVFGRSFDELGVPLLQACQEDRRVLGGVNSSVRHLGYQASTVATLDAGIALAEINRQLSGVVSRRLGWITTRDGFSLLNGWGVMMTFSRKA